MHDLAVLTKAMADESRLRIVGALADGQLCVCQLVELLQLAPSTVSKHLAILRGAGLLLQHKRGRWVYYELAGNDADFRVRSALYWLLRELNKEAQAEEDKLRLSAIKRLDPEKLCELMAQPDYVPIGAVSGREMR